MTDLSDREFRQAEAMLGGYRVRARVRNRHWKNLLHGTVVATSSEQGWVYVLWDGPLPTERWSVQDLEIE